MARELIDQYLIPGLVSIIIKSALYLETISSLNIRNFRNNCILEPSCLTAPSSLYISSFDVLENATNNFPFESDSSPLLDGNLFKTGDKSCITSSTVAFSKR